jgi:hypothetical protein
LGYLIISLIRQSIEFVVDLSQLLPPEAGQKPNRAGWGGANLLKKLLQFYFQILPPL